MLSDLRIEMRALNDHEHRMAALRRFKNREMLRIGFSDIVRGAPLEPVTADISNLADAVLQIAYEICFDRMLEKYGSPANQDGAQASMCVIAMGKLGGRELNYSSDIDLIYLFSETGKVNAARASDGFDNQSFFDRLAEDITQTVSRVTPNGFVFRVDTRLRPDGSQGSLTRSLSSALEYYKNKARTWEHQALIKVRCCAGDEELGSAFCESVTMHTYKSSFGSEEIRQTKATKRGIESDTSRKGQAHTSIKTGIGGIRDVEFIVQFHLMLHGHEFPEIRTGSTLTALQALTAIDAITGPDANVLEEGYRFLRKTEHRVMTLHQMKRHALPKTEKELRQLAVRMGFDATEGDVTESFLEVYQNHTRQIRAVFDRALGDLFNDEDGESSMIDLVLSQEEHELKTLEGVGFQEPSKAIRIIHKLSQEDAPPLRTPRTKKFLANIAPELFNRIGRLPYPDASLINFERIVSSLGSKTKLYQWLTQRREAIRPLVELCSGCDFLINYFSDGGMFDVLVDSLLTREMKDRSSIIADLRSLLVISQEPVKVLKEFHDAEMLHIGTHDRLGHLEPLEAYGELSQLAEQCLQCAFNICFENSARQYGVPLDIKGNTIPFAVLGMGKIGGAELNYFSDLDVMFVYGGKGKAPDGIFSVDFFTRLCQGIVKLLSEPAANRIYEIDARLRPSGSQSPLATSTDYIESYYFGGKADLWERQALTKVRVVAGDFEFGNKVIERLHEHVYSTSLQSDELNEILAMRQKLEGSVSADNFKRGRGGIVDIEFIIQILRLVHGHQHEELRHPSEMKALDAIESLKLIPIDHCHLFRRSYVFLRRLENRLRMATNRAEDVLPENEKTLNELAHSMLYDTDGGELKSRTVEIRSDCRNVFEQVIKQLRSGLSDS
jgi:glutamate-ammonia-ligase adenylyltransferase